MNSVSFSLIRLLGNVVFRLDQSCVDTPDARTLLDFNLLRISPEFLIDKPGILFIGLSIISN